MRLHNCIRKRYHNISSFEAKEKLSPTTIIRKLMAVPQDYKVIEKSIERREVTDITEERSLI